MTVEIVNFQITPYSDSVVEKINALPSGDLYSIFSRVINPDVLTAALYAIYIQESEAAVTCMETLASAYRRDEYLFQGNINELILLPNVFVLLIDGRYSGHVYSWTSNTITNVVGLRPSIDQLKDSRCMPDFDIMGPVFLNAIYDWIKANGAKTHRVKSNGINTGTPPESHYLRVLQPVGFLPKVLSDCGFVPAQKYNGKKEYRWMFSNQSIGSTPLATGLLFREWDYIKLLQEHRSLPCPVSEYKYTEII